MKCGGALARIVDIISAADLQTMATDHPLAVSRESQRFMQSTTYLLVQYCDAVPRTDSTIAGHQWETLGKLNEVLLSLRYSWVLRGI